MWWGECVCVLWIVAGGGSSNAHTNHTQHYTTISSSIGRQKIKRILLSKTNDQTFFPLFVEMIMLNSVILLFCYSPIGERLPPWRAFFDLPIKTGIFILHVYYTCSRDSDSSTSYTTIQLPWRGGYFFPTTTDVGSTWPWHRGKSVLGVKGL